MFDLSQTERGISMIGNHKTSQIEPGEVRLRELSEKVLTPQALSYQRVAVDLLSAGCLFGDYVEEEFRAVTQMIELRGGHLNLSFTKKVDDVEGEEATYVATTLTKADFFKYCNTLLKTRVDWVNGTRALFHPATPIAVPSFLSLLMSNIGLAEDYERGIVLYPQYSPKDVFVEKEMLSISALLHGLSQSFRYEVASGYKRDKMGSWELMAMQLIGGVIVSDDNKAHPVYATMCSVLGLKMLEEVLLPRVRYADVNLLRQLLRQVTSVGAVS